jgi:hypothetical protein
MWKLVIAAWMLSLISSFYGQQEQHYVILPAQEASAVASLYPKKGPARITGSWQASKENIEGLEAYLSHISDFKFRSRGSNDHIEHPDQYFRQYVAALRAGRKMIFVNAFCEVQLFPGLRKSDHLLIVSDGGACFWHAFYDPETQKFSDFEVNVTA